MEEVYDFYLDEAALGGVLGVILIVYLVIVAFAAIWGIISYIFSSLGMYTVANRRGIKNAWLAWIPVGNAWIIGSISDQYQRVAKNKHTRRRTTIMIMIIATYVSSMISAVAYVAQIVMMGAGEVEGALVTGALGSGFGGLLTSGLAVAYSVIYYFCLYDYFASAKPENAVLYLVLAILVGVVTPFLIFSCRNKDQGMVPPPQPQYYPPVYGQQPPVYGQQPPVYGQQPTVPTWQSVQNPTYQPPQPPAEPWQQRPEQ